MVDGLLLHKTDNVPNVAVKMIISVLIRDKEDLGGEGGTISVFSVSIRTARP